MVNARLKSRYNCRTERFMNHTTETLPGTAMVRLATPIFIWDVKRPVNLTRSFKA
jgi:hypothetical protein